MAPTYVALSRISGGASSGNCAIGSRNMATRPMITVMIEMTLQTDRPVDEEFGHGDLPRLGLYCGAGLASGIALNGFESTVMPAFTLWVPLGDNLLACFSPSSMIHSVPTRSPTLTDRMLTFLMVADYGHLVITL